MVDDNFHYQDEGARHADGTYGTVEEALAACRAIVDRTLRHEYRPGMTADTLYGQYTDFGDDPFIVVIGGEDERAKFSAWAYAKERAEAICTGGA
jgi:hypothetical protein